MDNNVEKKYIILFAILIAITGSTFESQSQPGQISTSSNNSQIQQDVVSRYP